MNAPRILRLQEGDGTASQQEAFTDPDSMTGRVDTVHRSFGTTFPSGPEGPVNFVEEVYDAEILARVNEQTVRIPYTLSEDGTSAAFGQMENVKVTLNVQTLESAEGDPETTERFTAGLLDSHIIESADDGAGWVWRVTMVKPGVSKNRRHYTADVLSEAVELYEGAQSFDGHRDTAERRRSSVGNMAGWHENVHAAPDGSLISDFHISESRSDIRQLFMTAWKNKRPNLIGFSHDISAVTESAVMGGQRVSAVRKIVEVHSVDIVADPSAGGRIERLVASRQKEDGMQLEEFLRAMRAGELSQEQISEAYAENPEWEKIVEASGVTAQPATEPATEPIQETPETPEVPVALSGMIRQMVIESAVRGAGLPEQATERLNEALSGAQTEDDIVRIVQETKSIWDAAMAARPAALPGQRAQVTEDEADKLQKGLDAMISGEREIDGVPAFRTVKEAYSAFTGRNPYQMGDEDFNRWILAESIGAVPHFGATRLTESMTTASWTEALGDSIRRALIREYSSNQYDSWRQIVSDITSPPDFRTNRRVRIGGYDVLPTVAEGAVYVAQTSPADEEATFAVTKKGGTEDYTLEMVANDDLSALRRIPRLLGRAAALTLYRAIWNTTIAGNATIYDTDPLFDVAHGNDTATTPLDEAGITALRTKMMDQQMDGETSGYVGITPRHLAVPSELWVPAFKLANSSAAVVGTAESATTPNPYQGLNVIEVPTLTDANDWYLIADPASIPTIEVGFYQGRQDPELLVQDQPAVGSVFTNDTFTWKIRHIWGLTVLDFRGFQRATQV